MDTSIFIDVQLVYISAYNHIWILFPFCCFSILRKDNININLENRIEIKKIENETKGKKNIPTNTSVGLEQTAVNSCTNIQSLKDVLDLENTILKYCFFFLQWVV